MISLWVCLIDRIENFEIELRRRDRSGRTSPASSVRSDDSRRSGADRARSRFVRDNLPVITPMKDADFLDPYQERLQYAGLFPAVQKHMHHVQTQLLPFSRNADFQSNPQRNSVLNKLVLNSLTEVLRNHLTSTHTPRLIETAAYDQFCTWI